MMHVPNSRFSARPGHSGGLFGAIKEVASEFSDDDIMTQSAALAFYSGLAMAPLLTISVLAARMFFGDEAKTKIITAFNQVIGEQAAQPIKELLDPATQQLNHGMSVAGTVSLVILAFSAASVFGQLQSALNSVWDVKAKPGNTILGFINKRLLSLGMLLSILFLLMISLIISAVLQGFAHLGGSAEGVIWEVLNNAVSIVIFTALFTGLFKYVPDAKVQWKPAWVGGAISAVLFTIGKIALAYYVGRVSYQTSYGAAVGSFLALLVWVYYSSIIVLIGAEVTQVYAKRSGHAVEPSEHAVAVKKEEIEQPKK